MYLIDALNNSFSNEDNGLIERLIIAVVLLFIPLIGQVVLIGFGLRVIRQYAEMGGGLPRFNDFGGDLVRGLMFIAASVIYAIPLIVASFLLALVTANADFLFTLVMALIFVAAIFVQLVVVAASVRYAISGESSTLFQFSENINVVLNNANAGITLLLNLVVLALVAALLVTLGFMLCFLPGLIASVVVQFSQYYLYARYGEQLGLFGKPKRKIADNAPLY